MKIRSLDNIATAWLRLTGFLMLFAVASCELPQPVEKEAVSASFKGANGAENINGSSILIEWTIPDDPAIQGFNVYLSTDLSTPLITLGPDVDFWVHEGLSEFSTKSYIVRSIISDSGTEDANRKAVSATTFTGGDSYEALGSGSYRVYVQNGEANKSRIKQWLLYGYFIDTSKWEKLSSVSYMGGYLSGSVPGGRSIQMLRARIIPNATLTEDQNDNEIELVDSDLKIRSIGYYDFSNLDDQDLSFPRVLMQIGVAQDFTIECTSGHTVSLEASHGGIFSESSFVCDSSEERTISYTPSNPVVLRQTISISEATSNVSKLKTIVLPFAKVTNAETIDYAVSIYSKRGDAGLSVVTDLLFDAELGLKVDSLISKLIAKGLWSDVVDVWITRSAYNVGTGTTLVSLKGDYPCTFRSRGTPASLSTYWNSGGISFDYSRAANSRWITCGYYTIATGDAYTLASVQNLTNTSAYAIRPFSWPINGGVDLVDCCGAEIRSGNLTPGFGMGFATLNPSLSFNNAYLNTTYNGNSSANPRYFLSGQSVAAGWTGVAGSTAKMAIIGEPGYSFVSSGTHRYNANLGSMPIVIGKSSINWYEYQDNYVAEYHGKIAVNYMAKTDQDMTQIYTVIKETIGSDLGFGKTYYTP